MPKPFLSLHRSNIIKGLAILAVLTIHISAYFPGIYNGEGQLFFIAIDQLARFCVPAFLIISGYGLATKYEGQKIDYISFVKKRIGKLLPLYLLWSCSSILIIRSVPAWSFGNQPMSFWVQMFAGQADYQLYFLPVLFQLYALFPLIWLMRKKANLLLLGALLLQAAFYMFYTSKLNNSDRLEYVIFISWILYFVFGVYLQIQKLPQVLLRLALPGAVIFFLVTVCSSLVQINGGLDPLPALKFTRLIVIPFALLTNLALIKISWPWKNVVTKTAADLLTWLGKNSYLIFLSHTIGLRLIYAISTKQLDSITLLFTISTWLITIWLSLKMINKNQVKVVVTPWWLYIVECADGTYYTGITPDIKKRLAKHNTGRGAKYTAFRGPVQLLYYEQHLNRSTATQRELQIKKLTRQQKKKLISDFLALNQSRP